MGYGYLKVAFHSVTIEHIFLEKRSISSMKDAKIAEAVAISEITCNKGESKLPFGNYKRVSKSKKNLATIYVLNL